MLAARVLPWVLSDMMFASTITGFCVGERNISVRHHSEHQAPNSEPATRCFMQLSKDVLANYGFPPGVVANADLKVAEGG